MRLLVLLLAVLATACATKMGRDGQRESVVDAKYLMKTEIDRVADTDRAEVVAGLMLIADKLYRRNPREWKKSSDVPNREAALARLQQRTPPAELQGAREGQAASLAFREDYAGDRVAALTFGLLTMVDAAFEHKEEFFILDGLNEQKLANCARNMEIAVWKLASAHNGAGEPFLLSNELDAGNRNLSFEREFGRIIGLLDFMARIVADRNGRSLSRFTQSVATAVFLPVGLLK
ncbi:MAG TPA: hypothetical protein VFF03_00650 [Rhodocyclaceae bacterium]|nr:hypothetical protein [Rhodocyclaceae bacterium]